MPCVEVHHGHARHESTRVGSCAMPSDSDKNSDEEADAGASMPIGLAEAYSVESPDDNRALYAKWADT